MVHRVTFQVFVCLGLKTETRLFFTVTYILSFLVTLLISEFMITSELGKAMI